MTDLPRRLAAELLGTAFLVATVVGSSVMATSLTQDMALTLLANSLASGAILMVLIAVLGPLSGAHVNPAVTLVFAIQGDLRKRDGIAYVAAQLVGGVLGASLAHAMFTVPIVEVSSVVRSGAGIWFSEGVATFGLIAVILAGVRFQRHAVPWIVGLYIFSAYWFTASSSFANPALTIARMMSNTPAGIRPADLPGFLLPQLVGALSAYYFMAWLLRKSNQSSLPLSSEDQK